MLLDHFTDLFKHMEWADSSVWTLIQKESPALTDEFALSTLMHIQESQHAFLVAWTKAPFARRKREEFPTNLALGTWGKEFHASLPSFLESVTETNLQSPSVLPWAKYFARTLGFEPKETTLQETLHQLISHTMHHRGQLVRRLRELGMTPPTTDYIAWVWAGRPATSWPF